MKKEFYSFFEELEKKFLYEAYEDPKNLDDNTNLERQKEVLIDKHRNIKRDEESINFEKKKVENIIPSKTMPPKKIDLIKKNIDLKRSKIEVEKGKTWDKIRDISQSIRQEKAMSEGYFPTFLKNDRESVNLSLKKEKKAFDSKQDQFINLNKKIEEILFFGFSGNVLSFFIKGKMLDKENEKDLNIIEKMKNDSIIKRIISNMKREIKKNEPNNEKLKILKLQFNNIFNFYKKKED